MNRASRKTNRVAGYVFVVMILMFACAFAVLRIADYRRHSTSGNSSSATAPQYQRAVEPNREPLRRLISPVMDDANIIWPDESGRMNLQLETLERQGGPQIVVATERNITGGGIAEDALERGRKWGIGHGGRNDGVLLLIARDERKARIEVGYGLEGVLTDALSRTIIETRMAPLMAQDRWTEAARAGLDGILDIVHPAPIDTKPTFLHDLGQAAGMLLMLAAAAAVLLGILQGVLVAIPGVYERLDRSRRWRWMVRVRILGSSGRSSDSSSSSSGSSSGSIGGGGSFGGGGAND